ncbi:hypothetical protein VDIAB_100798 [Vibrio diabolicus]|nr:hypothetical protein VDIAB_100798 [Vibrio diabolicus]
MMNNLIYASCYYLGIYYCFKTKNNLDGAYYEGMDESLCSFNYRGLNGM